MPRDGRGVRLHAPDAHRLRHLPHAQEREAHLEGRVHRLPQVGPGVNFTATHPTTPTASPATRDPPSTAPAPARRVTRTRARTGRSPIPARRTARRATRVRPITGQAAAPPATTTRGPNWAYAHPTSGDCSACHADPRSTSRARCSSCHKNPGRTWAFSHPGSKSTCTSCHTRPAGHKSGSCASCHKSVGKSWRFSHPGSKATARHATLARRVTAAVPARPATRSARAGSSPIPAVARTAPPATTARRPQLRRMPELSQPGIQVDVQAQH